MRSKDIKVGVSYHGRQAHKVGGSVRTVTATGLKLRGTNPAAITQVVFIEDGQEDWRYLDTFAAWAEKEVKP